MRLISMQKNIYIIYHEHYIMTMVDIKRKKVIMTAHAYYKSMNRSFQFM